MVVPSYLHLNPFRVLGDLAHISSKCILIWSIHWNKSAEGVSLLTQMLYALVFITRYLDIVEPAQWDYWYLPFFKVFYIVSSLYIVFLMVRVYPRTREKEKAWKLAMWSVLGSLTGAPLVIFVLYAKIGSHWFLRITWTFSIILESVCVLPQLLLLRQTHVPTVIDSYYLLTLGSYRALYILNWLVRGFGPEKAWDPIPDFFGVVQTALYIDFAWVYYSRQRVKLRKGGIVDSDDFRKGWLLRGIFNAGGRRGGHAESEAGDDEEESRPLDPETGENGGRTITTTTTNMNHWGPRGISVSADDTLPERDPNAP